MLSANTRGVFVISATPFTDGGEIDYRSVDTLMDFYLARGVHGITIPGMMGEVHDIAELQGSVCK